MAEKENEVFAQEVSPDELDNVAGGKDSDTNNCTRTHKRDIYGGNGFANCAATVGDGSWCGTNDACYSDAVDYQNMFDCSKAWR